MEASALRLHPEESVAIELPYSEVCIHMKIAGQVHEVELGPYAMARIEGFPPVLAAEAGILADSGGYYVPEPLVASPDKLPEKHRETEEVCGWWST